jgi:hypothetical protein
MRHILMTWNPGPDDDQQWSPAKWERTMVKETAAGRTVETGWSVAHRRNDIEPGDLAYLYRQGEHGRGLVAIGEIQTEPVEDERWDDPKRTANYVRIEWIECVSLDDRITIEELEAAIPTFPWEQVYSSGREVKGADGAKLYELWNRGTTEVEDGGAGEGGGSVDGEDDGGGVGVGGGFGDAETNRRVELAAMDVVMSAYRSEGFDVKDESAAKCGWDITARKNSEVFHIEVKGVTGQAVTFLLTAHEFDTAKDDPQWLLAVISKALTDPQYYELDAADVLAHAQPFMYQVRVPEDVFA